LKSLLFNRLVHYYNKGSISGFYINFIHIVIHFNTLHASICCYLLSLTNTYFLTPLYMHHLLAFNYNFFHLYVISYTIVCIIPSLFLCTRNSCKLYYKLFCIQRYCYPSWAVESEINYVSSLKVRFWSSIERVVIIQHPNMSTVIMLTINIYCIKACTNVQRENNVLQNFYPWHRDKIGIKYHFVCFSCLMIGDHDPRWRRIWQTWCVKLIPQCYKTYAFLT